MSVCVCEIFTVLLMFFTGWSFFIRFGFYQIKLNRIFLKKKHKPVQTDRFRFGSVRFLEKKPVQTGLAWFFRFGSILAWFFPVWLGFSVWLGFGSVFSGLAWFFFSFFGLGSVWFGFFCFRLIKPKPNRTGWFFQNFNRFFFMVWFFWLFFSSFLVFLLTPSFTTRKLINTNGNTDGIFSSVNFRGILPTKIFPRYILREIPWKKN